MANILDGKITSAIIRAEVAENVRILKRDQGIVPGLAAVFVGDNPASAVYIRNKSKACADVGINSRTFHLPQETSAIELIRLIEKLNADPTYNGILVQLPLPSQIDESSIVLAINPEKDIDAIHPINVGKVSQGKYSFVPCTPGGIQQLLTRNGYYPEGKHIVICGRSNIVGKPLAMLLAQKSVGGNATTTICHTATTNLKALTKQADILVAAIGKPRAITADMIKEGAIVVDVGINRVADESRKSGYRLDGDVDFESVSEKAGAITPVPGGVGPMTISQLLVNTLTAAQLAI